jgi:hypothetical protein
LYAIQSISPSADEPDELKSLVRSLALPRAVKPWLEPRLVLAAWSLAGVGLVLLGVALGFFATRRGVALAVGFLGIAALLASGCMGMVQEPGPWNDSEVSRAYGDALSSVCIPGFLAAALAGVFVRATAKKPRAK